MSDTVQDHYTEDDFESLLDDARRAALSHARRGGRVEVGAFVPLGEAVPGSEWRGVK